MSPHSLGITPKLRFICSEGSLLLSICSSSSSRPIALRICLLLSLPRFDSPAARSMRQIKVERLRSIYAMVE